MATAKNEKSEMNPLAYVLELVGSLIFIVLLIYTSLTFSSASSNLFILAAGAFWLPVVYATAIITSVMLFLASFTNLMHTRSSMSYKYPVCLSVLAGFSWCAISGGNAALTLVATVGFTVAFIGGIFGMYGMQKN